MTKIKTCTTKKMTKVDRAWLAGFFDGEGSIFTYKGGRNKKSTCWRISVPNTCLESLEYCKKITGVGSIIKKPVKPRHKQQWIWKVDRLKDIESILDQMYPYLQIKQLHAWGFFYYFGYG